MSHGSRISALLLPLLAAACSQQPPAPQSAATHDATLSPGARVLLAADGNTDSERDFRKIINTAKAKVFPAVVFIRCVQQDLSSGENATNQVAGSGVLISETGEVLTNWHVVDKAVEVRCLLYNGNAYDAKVLGSDKDADLALLKLGKALGDASGDMKASTTQKSAQAAEPFPFARIGDSSHLQEGDFVMAMGAPWGLSRSVSLGIISCTNRYLPTVSEYSIWLQTDAAISPGNSGGPLVNTDGYVIGINTRGMSTGGDLGFAVPSSTILPVLAQLRDHGKVNWTWTGLQLQPLRDFEKNVYFEGTRGVIISDTDPDSPARHAGLQPRDRILSINGAPVTALTDEDLPDIRRMLGLLPLSTPAQLEIQRGTQTMTIALSPREKGKVEGDALVLDRWDCTVKTINQFDNPDLYFQRKQGLFVFGTKYPGNAANAGLQQDDVILQVDGKPVTTLDDLKPLHNQTLKNIRNRPRVVLTVLRNGLMRQVVLDISRDYSKQ